MHTSTLERLVCPTCHSPLHLAAAVRWLGPGRVELGAAACGCSQYAIESGILDLYPSTSGLTPAQWSNALGLTAWGYERVWRPRALTLLSGEPFPLTREFGVVLDLLQPEPHGLYLDLGCSTALQARALARHWATTGGTARVVALDYSMSMLRAAAERIQSEGWTSIDLVRARAEQLPFGNKMLTGVVCGGTLNEFGAPLSALVEAHRVTRAAGRAVFMSLLASGEGRGKVIQHELTLLSGLKFWTPEKTKTLYTTAGWRVTEQQVWGRVAFTVLQA